MRKRILHFFHYMSDNPEKRLYYVLPLHPTAPYAYQHSAIRDLGTVCDILALESEDLTSFETLIGNTLRGYPNPLDLPDEPISTAGLYLLLMERCKKRFPSLLPSDWQTTRRRLIDFIGSKQNKDGSLRIPGGEAFYLPEALIGLIAAGGSEEVVRKGVAYCCQEKVRQHHLASDEGTFYANWQFQLLYHWLQVTPATEQELQHLHKLVEGLRISPIARHPFGAQAATVEVACYLEGLAHARLILGADPWFEKEIERALQFLAKVQEMPFHGGFAHSLTSHEARIDVAGHVFNALAHIKRFS